MESKSEQEEAVATKEAVELSEQELADVAAADGPDLSPMPADVQAQLAEILAEIREAHTERDPKMAESRKDEIYVATKSLMSKYKSLVKNTGLEFLLTKDQYEYMLNVLETQLTYGVDEVFTAVQLRDMFLAERPVFHGRTKPSNVAITAEVMQILYLLISKHRVKGLGQTAQNFVAILLGIGRAAKAYNHFDQLGAHVQAEVDSWIAAVTPAEDPAQTGGAPAENDAASTVE